MEIGITTWSLSKTAAKDIYEYIDYAKASGFGNLDLTLDHYANIYDWINDDESKMIQYFKEVKAYADNKGIRFSQLHAPYTLFPNYLFSEYENLIERSIKIAGVLECPYIVAHPLVFPQYRQNDLNDKEKRFNINFFKKFIPLLQANNAKIALENIYDWTNERTIRVINVSTPEGLNSYLDELPEAYFGICFDTGHLHIAGYPMEDGIKAWNKRIKVLHITDNFGKLDDHLLPYQGTIDWTNFKKYLDDVGFDGVYSLEIKPLEVLSKTQSGMKLAAEITKTFDK